MSEIIELRNKIADDEIIAMYAVVKKQLPEGDEFAAFERGVRQAEAFYTQELRRRMPMFPYVIELIKKRGIDGVEVNESDGNITIKVEDIPNRPNPKIRW